MSNADSSDDHPTTTYNTTPGREDVVDAATAEVICEEPVANVGTNTSPENIRDFPGALLPGEYWWRDRQKWLEQKGYMLRPRLRPGWMPSWEGTQKLWYKFEDGVSMCSADVIDATRISDGRIVMLKRISQSLHEYEVEIAQFFSTEPLASGPRNHCVRIQDTLHDPFEADYQIVVMPLLRAHDDPSFATVGEIVEFFRQLFEGLQFMHENRVAHRDCMLHNIMMDPAPMFPELFHPVRPYLRRDFKGPPKFFSRTERPTKYYYIDFGHSRRYPPDISAPHELPIIGGDKSVPEHQGAKYNEYCDPFRTDVYCIGNMIRTQYLEQFLGLRFMETLVAEMTSTEPLERPTMTEVVTRFEQILSGISSATLRRRLSKPKESALARLLRDARHWVISTGYIIQRLPPLPKYTLTP